MPCCKNVACMDAKIASCPPYPHPIPPVVVYALATFPCSNHPHASQRGDTDGRNNPMNRRYELHTSGENVKDSLLSTWHLTFSNTNRR